MKIQLLVSLLALFTVRGYSQSDYYANKASTGYFGKNLLTSESLHGFEYDFTERIDEYYLDTISNTVTFQLRGLSNNGKNLKNKGEILLFDLEERNTRWRKSFNYYTKSITQKNALIIENTAYTSSCINIENGSEKFDINTSSISYIDSKSHVGLGYGKPGALSTANTSSTIIGSNLNNGQRMWFRDINHEYGWNELLRLNDSVLVIVSSGIHTINLYTGKGWSFHAVTGRDDYTAAAITNAAGIALGILTGTYVTSSGYNTVRSIASNVIEDSSRFYFASKDNVSCIDVNTGKIIWSQALPKDYMCKSTLLIHKNILYLVGHGFAYMGERKIKYGQTFLAAFGLSDGNPVFLHPIDSIDFVNATYIRYDSLFLLTKNSILNYSIVDGNQLSRNSYNTDSVGGLKYFTGANCYIARDSSFLNIARADTNKLFIYTTRGNILVLNDSLQIEKQYRQEDLFFFKRLSDSLVFLANEKKCLILDNVFHQLAEVNASNSTFLVDKKLYCIKEKSLMEIDLSDVLKN